MSDDWYEEDEGKAEKIVAERECKLALQSNYQIGYQGALIATLEER